MLKILLTLGIIGSVLLVGSKYLTTRVLPQSIPAPTEPKIQLEEPEMTYTSPPEMQLKENTDYKAVIKTSKGEIKLDLFEKEAPITTNNFIFLANEGFYNNTPFHRIIKDFMIQGGDPTGTGTGGPGYTFEDEINDHKLVKGSLAMANAGANTNGSQFFIVTAEETPWLDGAHTNFGKVLEGTDVITTIENAPTDSQDKPTEELTIETITITEE